MFLILIVDFHSRWSLPSLKRLYLCLPFTRETKIFTFQWMIISSYCLWAERDRNLIELAQPSFFSYRGGVCVPVYSRSCARLMLLYQFYLLYSFVILHVWISSPAAHLTLITALLRRWRKNHLHADVCVYNFCCLTKLCKQFVLCSVYKFGFNGSNRIEKQWKPRFNQIRNSND